MSLARAKTGARAAMIATIATVATSAGIALLASRPESPLTPPLPRGGEAPMFLARAAEALSLDELSRDVAATLSAILMFAAAAAFLYTLRHAWRGAVTVRHVLIVGVLLHILALVTPLFLSRDVYSYSMYGRMVSEYEANPYVTTPGSFPEDPFFPLVSEDWRDSPSVYGPAFVALSAGTTGVASSPATAVWAFKLVAAVAGVATMLLVVAAARRVRPERAAFAAALVGWNPVVLFHGVAGGHNDALVGLALAGAVLLLVSRKELAATAVLVLGSLVKVTAGLALIVAVATAAFRHPRGQRLRALGEQAGVGALIALPFVIPFIRASDPTLGALELSTRHGWLAPSAFLWRLFQGAGRVLGIPAAGTALGHLARFAFPVIMVAVLVAVLRHLARDPRRISAELVVAAMGWVTLIALMTAPLLLPWYAVVVMPFVWLLPREARIGAVFLAATLASTEFVADPASSPGLWEAMVVVLRWVASPVALVVLVRLLLELRRRLALDPGWGESDPLLLEHLPPSSSPAVSPRVRGHVPRPADQDGSGDATGPAGGGAHTLGGDRAEDQSR